MSAHIPQPTPEERFWSLVTPTGFCWEWEGTLKRSGYGVFKIGKTRIPAHCYSYHVLVGDYPHGLDLDHLCRNRRCVNPDHLEPVTRKENLARGFGHGSETHCPSGHPYSEENTYKDGGSRVCKTCKRARNARARARRASHVADGALGLRTVPAELQARIEAAL